MKPEDRLGGQWSRQVVLGAVISYVGFRLGWLAGSVVAIAWLGSLLLKAKSPRLRLLGFLSFAAAAVLLGFMVFVDGSLTKAANVRIG